MWTIVSHSVLTWLLLGLVVQVITAGRTPHYHHHPHSLPHHDKPASAFVNNGKICIGTNGRMSVPSNREQHYRNLRDRFTNCTYVDGNLELTWLQNEHLDLSFLQYIREITGYVLISHVDVRRIILPRLEIIRGRTLFKMNVRDEEFALLVTLSNTHSLELPALRDVLSGSVGIYNNYNLCHVKTINWEEIISGPKAGYVYLYNFTSAERECPPCDKSCGAGCWGEGPENCQKFSKTNCSPQCWQGRCFGSNPRECCHLFCAGGCTGPTQSDCLACRNFFDGGLCTQECPPMQKYNPTSYSWEVNPNGKYAYGATCVKDCPLHLLKDNGACVRSCPPKKTAVNGECVPCDGPCPKTCPGVKSVHSGNIDGFKDCTIIDGSLEILEQSFKGFQQVYNNFSFGPRYQKMHPDRLDVFSTLKEVTGYINIQGYHEEFTNLSYFRNLEVIGGRQLMENFFASLYIVKTALKSLELKSLRKINSGAVVILENKNLCFAQHIAWENIKKSTEHASLLQNNKDEKDCKAEGLVCDPQCSSEGCWGAGADQCLLCRNYQFGDTCLENCDIFTGMYKAGAKTCKPCHKECASTCHGPGQEHCTKCKNALDGPFCVPKCPTTKYRTSSGECVHCHENCIDGCVGPLNTIGLNGCNSCEKAIINCDVTVDRCLQKNETCPDSYYSEWVGPQEQGPLKPLAGKAICRKCHPRCKKCTGYGFHEQVCQECTKFKRGEQCEDECPSDHYADEFTQICVPCHIECRGCVGPDASQCMKCRNFKIFIDGEPSSDNSTAFNCTANCPEELRHKIFPNEISNDPYCSAEPEGSLHFKDSSKDPSIFMICLIIGVVIIFTLFTVIFCICKQKAIAKTEASTMKMAMAMTEREDNQPLQPTNVKPNLAQLRIVKEVELRKGGLLGSGAFGKVFKGTWEPEGDNFKIPVAIKVLREGTGANTSKEFLEEAYIMASVVHPNLLQLLGVCMTSQMMLITQLMPSGCLLDYVRIHKDKIVSKSLLNWCTQISRGMAYLEDRRLVHRDLAARNVLVQTNGSVKITDFGLAKLLDYNNDVYTAAGGKMPIKWLALECIRHRIFTHKSDVWAFGVTVWELLTYGGRPYENIPARDVPDLIENGLKLPQPAICTLDIYCIMVSCWMLDAGNRPSFKYLAETFAEKAKDPGRYLVIPGDKYTRPPMPFQQDEKELLRSLPSVMECTEVLTEADEYLQPKYRGEVNMPHSTSTGIAHDIAHNSNKVSSSNSWQGNTCSTNLKSISLEGLSSSSNVSNVDQDFLRYPQTAADHRQYCNGVLHSDTSSTRYCSDPMKAGGKDELSMNDNFDSISIIKEAQGGNMKLDLPVDEDDYLMPSPQQNPGASTYMDLIDDTDNAESTENRQNFPNYSDFLNVKMGVDNPEYLFSPPKDCNISESSVIPKIPEPETVQIPTSSTAQGSDGVSPVTYVAQKSIEEESISDHEYYNDFQRELQPLRRNETTV